MTEDNKTPGEADPSDVRRQLADIGAPLTPNVVNCDNQWREPTGRITGDVSGVNADSQEVPEFVPTRHELSVLVKHWMAEVIDYDFFFFCHEQTCSSGSRRSHFARRRINSIGALISDEAVEVAIDEAYEEYGKGRSEAWHVYLHGTEDERRTFRARCEEALRTREDD